MANFIYKKAKEAILNRSIDVTINSVTNDQILRYNGSQLIGYAEANLVDGGNP